MSKVSVGDLAPYFSGVDQNGQTLSSEDLSRTGPFVLIFYRGYWCSYCMAHLTSLQKIIDSINDAGVQIVVVTPEQKQFIKKTISKTKVKFPVIQDSYYYIMESYGFAYKPRLNKAGPLLRRVDLTEVHENEEVKLPRPSTFIIDQNRKIRYKQLDGINRKKFNYNKIMDLVREIKVN